MGLEDFQLLDNQPIVNSIKKRDFTNVYHQSGANLNDSNQNVDFIFGQNNNYHQIGNGYLEFDIAFRDTAGNFTDASVIRLVNNAYAFRFKRATLATTGGMDLEDIKYVGQVSTILRLLTSKHSDLSSCFDKNAEKPLKNDNPLKQIFGNNHAEDVSSRRVSRSDGGWRSLCIKIGYSELTRAESREGTSTRAESSRVT